MKKSFDEMEDNIRPPDKVVRQKLIQDTRSEFDNEIDQALYASVEEFKKQQELYNRYEEDVINEFLNECIKRKKVFELFLLDLNKIVKYDKEIKEIFNIIEPIIDLYCNQQIEIVHLEEVTYEKIFVTLGKTRVNKVGLDCLKTIILKEI